MNLRKNIQAETIVRLFLFFSVLILSFFFNLYQYWPGWIDGDGSAMIWEAHYGWFESYLPVVMTGIIRLIFLLTTHSLLPVLIFQLCLAYLVLLVVFRWQEMPWSVVVVLTSIVMVLPPVSSYAGTIVKDVWFTWFAILATAALARGIQKKAWLCWTIWLISSALAISIRVDGISWFFAVILCGCIYQFRMGDYSGIFRLATSSTFSLAVFILLPIMIGKVVTVERRYPSQQIFLFDLAALSLAEGQLLIPEEFNPESHNLEFLKERFNPGSNMSILNWGQKKEGFLLVHEPEAHAILKHAWLKAVRNNKSAYLVHRCHVARQFLLGRPRPAAWFWYRYKTSANVFKETAASSTATRRFWQREVLDRAEASIVNQLWPYIVFLWMACGLVLVNSGFNSLFPLAITIGVSAYSGFFLMIAPNVGFRYYYFPVVSSVLVMLVFMVDRFWRKYRKCLNTQV